MLFKVILIFLLAMILVGMVGKVLFPTQLDRAKRRKPTRCPNCGKPLIGKACDCGKAR
ncbi:MAG: hypothetical protein WBP18_01040 [Paracoccaceae bacterium]|jgi:hypothetical protein